MPVINEATLFANIRPGEVHVAGIVVHADYKSLESIRDAIGMIPGAEIHAVTEQGKLVVTLEGRLMSEVAAQLNAIHALPGVYSAALVYQHHEDIASWTE